MPFLSASLDAYLLTSLLVSVPWVYLTGKSRHHPPQNSPPIRPYISILLLLHTLYILYRILVTPPANIFTSLNIPLNTSTDRIREIVAKYSGIDLNSGGAFPKPLELLLKRLSLFEHRTLFVRFGQHVLQTCEYCTTYDEFAIYAILEPLRSYVYEAAVVGAVTISGTQRERLRTVGLGVLVAAALAEGYWISTVPIKVPRRGEPNDVTMWHDALYIARQALFVVLPLGIHLLRGIPESESNPFMVLPQTITAMERGLSRLHLIKYIRGAVMRVPELRESAEAWWKVEKQEGEWVRGDENVRQIAEREGFGFGPFSDEEGSNNRKEREGKLRTSAQMALDGLLKESLGR
ncbi:hypothetical protein BDN71DRAFT_1448390 [Pleurotus eryngii]|uniref:Uncharacterized protein n=1 Tax=Pleurotus eryngii TaxID=5323 RepID=A0A9P6DF39_PLEER|nr:hypothetical protein BDN71DRAFT_1448390 [Pleurotus eryngii]